MAVNYQNQFLGADNVTSFTSQGTRQTAKYLGTEFRRSSSLDHKNPHDLLIKFSKNSTQVPGFMITLNFREKPLGKCHKKRVLAPQEGVPWVSLSSFDIAKHCRQKKNMWEQNHCKFVH